MQVHNYYAINISMHFSEHWDASKNESLNPVFFIHSALNFLSTFKFSKVLKTSFMKITLFFNDNGLWKSTIQKYMVVFIFFFPQRVAFYQIGLFQNFRLNTDQILSVRTQRHWLTSWIDTWRSLLPSSDWSRKRFNWIRSCCSNMAQKFSKRLITCKDTCEVSEMLIQH